MPIIAQSLCRLFEESTKCKRLNTAKQYTFPVIQHYAASDCEKFQKYAENILNCSNDLRLRVLTEIRPDAVIAHSSIENARWCRVRQCPMCGFARSSKMRAKLFKAFTGHEFEEDSYSFLTLTVRNCPLGSLRDTLKDMNEAWHRLSRRRTFPVLGYLRSMEVTLQRERMPWDKKKNTGPPVRSDETGELMAHPHFHIVLHTESGFKKHLNGKEGKQWVVDLWTESLRSDYRPSIQIAKIRPARGDFEKSLLETCKYTVKPDDFADRKPDESAPQKPARIIPEHPPYGAEWLYGITDQLHNLRAVRTGGTFAALCSNAALDKIDDSCSDDDSEAQSGNLVKLSWNDKRLKYDVVPDTCRDEFDDDDDVSITFED